ncbi:trehalose operon repressor [Lacticaseibacillus absianus]|uniref:trehalose operon repressor n=1 Tax=Lacticaseibacillus absianus TaxID=2729623 RepID=UPI0015C721E2|nr:trehalose operon repressor [Lacticaseibacillus absianus]
MNNKFKEIAADLEQKIRSGQYPPETLLPSEPHLMRLYNVSRETIRKALGELQVQGLIQKKQGKGSIVIDPNRFAFPVSGLTSYRELQQNLGLNSETVVLTLAEQQAPAELQTLTQWPAGTDVWHVERLRKVDGRGAILDIDDFRADIVPQLTKKIAQDSTYAYIEGKLKLEVAYAQKAITVEPATRRDRELLDLGQENKVVVIRSLVYLEDNTCFQYTQSRHILDKFRFVDIARRRHI